jgi:hypothetical protein
MNRQSQWLFETPITVDFDDDQTKPVLSLEKLKIPGLPEITLTRGSSGQFEGFFREPASSYNGNVTLSGKVQIEDAGIRRDYDYDRDRTRWSLVKAWANVEVGGAIGSSSASFSPVGRNGTFTTSTWIGYELYLFRRLAIQAIVESKDGKRFGAKAVVELIDLAGFLAIIDPKEKTRPSGQTHLQFLASVRKIYHGNAREPQFVDPFNFVLYRHRDVKPLFTFCTPEEESRPLKLRPKYCNPAEKAAEERLRLYKILYNNGEWLEIGHVLCGIEGSPKQEPDKDQSLPKPIRPDLIVTWAGDLGSAIQSYIQHYWYSTDKDGKAIDKDDPLDLNHYLVRDASRSDLIGDIDGINIGSAYDSSRSLAENLNAYYGKKSRRRYYEFIANSKNKSGMAELPLVPGTNPPKLSKQARQTITLHTGRYLYYLQQSGKLYYGKELAKRKRVDDIILRTYSNSLPLPVEIEKVVDYFVRFLEDGLALEQKQGVISQPEIEDLEMSKQSQWLFEVPFAQDRTIPVPQFGAAFPIHSEEEFSDKEKWFWQGLGQAYAAVQKARIHLKSKNLLATQQALTMAEQRLILAGKTIGETAYGQKAHVGLARGLVSIRKVLQHIRAKKMIAASQEIEKAYRELGVAMGLALPLYPRTRVWN